MSHMNIIIGRNMLSEDSAYERLKSLDRDDDDSHDGHASPINASVRLPRKLFITLLLCNILLFVASVYVLLVATFGRPAPSELECAKIVSPYCESCTREYVLTALLIQLAIQ